MNNSVKFTSAEGNPFVKAFIYIQANRDEWDAKISGRVQQC